MRLIRILATGLGRIALGLIGLLAASLLLAGCGRDPVHKQQAFVFGTLVEVSIYGGEEAAAQAALHSVLGEFDRLHRAWHPWEPGPMETLNAELAAGKTVALDAELAQALQTAQHLEVASAHLFNPAIGNLVRQWGFHTDTFVARRPAADAIAKLVKAAPRLSDLQINHGRLKSTNPALRIDLGGFAKGYALDRAATLLRQQGVNNALINIGGNVLALGQRGSRRWHIAIQHPRQPGGILAELDLNDGEAIGTSGDYQRAFDLDGQHYCHLLDPRTGQPVQHTQAVTILTRGAVDGIPAGTRSDALSKPLFIAGASTWLKLAQRLQLDHALRVDASGVVTVTPAFGKRLTFAPGVSATIATP